MLMAVKMGKIWLEWSRQATGLSSGFSIILDLMQVHHIVLQEAHFTVKKSLLPNIKVIISRPSMLELL